jgi:hypothetical protein
MGRKLPAVSMDFFDFFRYVLATVVTIYATLVTVQWAAGWYKWLSQQGRHTTLLRSYLIVSGLRLKVTTFWADVLISLMLCVIFMMLWHAHGIVGEIGSTLSDAHRKPQPLHWRGT